MSCKIFIMISSILFIGYLGLAAGRGEAASGHERLLAELNQARNRTTKKPITKKKQLHTSVEASYPLDTVKVIDKATKRPFAKTAVRIFRANSVVCIKAPCAPNDIDWRGVTNAKGIVRVPTVVMNRSTDSGSVTTFSAGGHVGSMDVTKDLRKIATASWTIALSHH